MANPQHPADQPERGPDPVVGDHIVEDHGHGAHSDNALVHDAHAHDVAVDFIPEGHFADTVLKLLALVFAPIGMIIFAAIMVLTPIPEHHGSESGDAHDGGAAPAHTSGVDSHAGETTGTPAGH